MDRRTFLKATTVTAGSGLALQSTAALSSTGDDPAAPALARAAKTLTFSSAWSDDIPVFADAARRLAARLQQALGDEFRIVRADEAVSDPDLTFGRQPVEIDAADAFFAGLPGSYGLAPMHHHAWLTVGGGQMLWDDLAAQHGWKPLLAGHSGPRPGLWTTFDLREASDFASRAIVISGGLGRKLARSLSVDVIEITPAEIATQLAEGQLDAVAWGNPLAGLMLGLPQAATHFYRGGIHQRGLAFALNVRLPVWESFSAATRVAFEGVAAYEFGLGLSESLAHERIAERTIARSASLSISDLPAQVSDATDEVTRLLLDDICTSSIEARRILDSYLAFHRMVESEPEAALSA